MLLLIFLMPYTPPPSATTFLILFLCLVCLQLNRGIMTLVVPPSGFEHSFRTIATYASVFKVKECTAVQPPPLACETALPLDCMSVWVCARKKLIFFSLSLSLFSHNSFLSFSPLFTINHPTALMGSLVQPPPLSRLSRLHHRVRPIKSQATG